jgi:hypothetical protein
MPRFKARTFYDGFDWIVKIADTIEQYRVSGTGDTREEAREAAKTALKQRYLDDQKEVPDWLNR